MIKQVIPQQFCLKCQGCCRFKEMGSAWSPCLLDEEIQDLLDQKIPPALISAQKKLLPIPNPQGEGFICPFLEAKDNKCKIYGLRPFECQLYPFLINLRDKKVILTLDLNCPYVREHLKDKEFKAYTDYLINFLNSPAQVEILKDNPQIIQAYEEVLDIIELGLPDEA
ncbi:MAG: YkgJ family cysteine cluster protein [Candidatus Omnitrophica bacterium]|nr:YkgJ family cysteine cluster protein [Candidatus Omnitrophota bacterium]MDD5592534.1 YkgJ family cysteine cluster protein [Candidatus Omnitrophota bacterium]